MRISEALPDGSGVAMLDGKMQDDATWKQAKVMVDSPSRSPRKDKRCESLRLLRRGDHWRNRDAASAAQVAEKLGLRRR